MSKLDIILVGSSGQAKEVLEILKENIEHGLEWNVLGYVAPESSAIFCEIPYLGNDDFLLSTSEVINVVIAIGDSKVRNKIVDSLKKKNNILFPNVISNSSIISRSISIGVGNIIQSGAIISTEVILQNFNLVNIGCTISHESKIDNYCTLCPGVHIAGNVNIKDYAFIGIGTSIIQGLSIGMNSIIGAGSTILQNVEDNVVVVGSPGRVLK